MLSNGSATINMSYICVIKVIYDSSILHSKQNKESDHG